MVISCKPPGENYQIEAKLGFGGFDEDKAPKIERQFYDFLELTKKWLVRLYNQLDIVSTKYAEKSECYISPTTKIDESDFEVFRLEYTSSTRV